MTVTRREIVISAIIGTFSAISGCIDYPTHREISIGAISAAQTESGWELKLTVVNDNTINGEKADFHDVRVHVYSRNKKKVCERTIGELTHKQNVNDGKDVSIKCQSFPYVVTFSAQESPCEKNTEIMIGRYTGKQNGEFIWATEYRECNEGLPPKFSTTQPLP